LASRMVPVIPEASIVSLSAALARAARSEPEPGIVGSGDRNGGGVELGNDKSRNSGGNQHPRVHAGLTSPVYRLLTYESTNDLDARRCWGSAGLVTR